jgi:hypothetical protein
MYCNLLTGTYLLSYKNGVCIGLCNTSNYIRKINFNTRNFGLTPGKALVNVTICILCLSFRAS